MQHISSAVNHFSWQKRFIDKRCKESNDICSSLVCKKTTGVYSVEPRGKPLQRDEHRPEQNIYLFILFPNSIVTRLCQRGGSVWACTNLRFQLTMKQKNIFSTLLNLYIKKLDCTGCTWMTRRWLHVYLNRFCSQRRSRSIEFTQSSHSLLSLNQSVSLSPHHPPRDNSITSANELSECVCERVHRLSCDFQVNQRW